MKDKMERVLDLQKITVWSEGIRTRRENLKTNLEQLPALVNAAVKWQPRQTATPNGWVNVKRPVGRPPRRWIDT